MVDLKTPFNNTTKTDFDFVKIAEGLLKAAKDHEEFKRLKSSGQIQIDSDADRKGIKALSKKQEISNDDRKRLGEPLYRAIEYFPKSLQDRIVRLVKENKFKPLDVEEIKFSVGGPVRIDDGVSDSKTGMPLLQLVDGYDVTTNDLLKVKQNLNYDSKSQRGGHLHPDDTSRFSFSYDNTPDLNGNPIPTHLTIRIAKPEIPDLPNEMKSIVDDAIANKKKVLFLGQTGVGKTTLMKMITKYLDKKQIETYVFDKSKEIGGHKPEPLKTLGRFVRRFVNQPLKTMSESIINMFENHNPKVGLFDELSDKFEFEAVRRSIVEKGMPTGFIFIHGRRLAEVMKSENISKLLAPIKEVIVGDAQAEKSGSGNVQDKTRYNLVGKPMVDVVVEMRGRNDYVIHKDAEASMKSLLEGKEPLAENVYGHNDLHFEPLDYFIEPVDPDVGDPTARAKKSSSLGQNQTQRRIATQSPSSLIEQMVSKLNIDEMKSLADSLKNGDLKQISSNLKKEWLRVVESAIEISSKVTTTSGAPSDNNKSKSIKRSGFGEIHSNDLDKMITELEEAAKSRPLSKSQRQKLKRLNSEKERRKQDGNAQVSRFNQKYSKKEETEQVRITSTDDRNPSVKELEPNTAILEKRLEELRAIENTRMLSGDESRELQELEIDLYAGSAQSFDDYSSDITKAKQDLADELGNIKG